MLKGVREYVQMFPWCLAKRELMRSQKQAGHYKQVQFLYFPMDKIIRKYIIILSW